MKRDENIHSLVRDAMKSLSEAEEMSQEEGHIAADDALCQLLEELGFSDVVEVYRDIPKWFA
jgi:hypothetical protein